MIISTYDAITGITTDRELNVEELKSWNEAKIAMELEAKRQAAKDADKAELLAKLGITADEAKLLLG